MCNLGEVTKNSTIGGGFNPFETYYIVKLDHFLR